MATIEQAYQRMKELKKAMRGIGMDVLLITSEEYLDMQRQQMMSGINNKGEKIGEYNSVLYGEHKFARNPKADGYVDLFDKGDYQRELTLREESPRKFIVYSQDWKNKLLQEKYGDSIVFLSIPYLNIYRRHFFHVPFKAKLNDFWNGR